jgi:hypothetical protein
VLWSAPLSAEPFTVDTHSPPAGAATGLTAADSTVLVCNGAYLTAFAD